MRLGTEVITFHWFILLFGGRIRFLGVPAITVVAAVAVVVAVVVYEVAAP